MRNYFSKFLMFLMTVSLIGIVILQIYWLNTSLDSNLEEFKYHIKQVLGNVADQMEEDEVGKYVEKIIEAENKGAIINLEEKTEIGYYEKDLETNQIYKYKGNIAYFEVADFELPKGLFQNDSVKLKGLTTKRQLEIFNEPYNSTENSVNPNTKIIKSGRNKNLDKALYNMQFKDINEKEPIQKRISSEKLKQMLDLQLKNYGVNTPFEFAIYSNGISTAVRSENFENDKYSTYNIPVFKNEEGISQYQLMVTFPEKNKYLSKKLISITILSFILIRLLTLKKQ